MGEFQSKNTGIGKQRKGSASVWNKGNADPFPPEFCSQMLVSHEKKNPHRSLVFFFPSRAGGTCVTYTKTVNLLIPQEHVQFRHLCRFTHGGVMAMPSDYMNRPRDHWNMLLRCLLVSTTTSTDLPVAPFRPWPVGCYGPLLLLDSLDEERRWREN